MPNTRTIRFWIWIALSTALWLAMLAASTEAESWNEAIYRRFYAGGSDFGRFAGFVTMLGDWIMLTILTILATIFLARHRRRRAAVLLVAVSVGRLLIELQKLVFAHQRPSLGQEIESLSFPSAHAGNTMITFLAIAFLLPVAHGWRNLAVAIAVGLSILVGLTRLWLGVHWPSDVVGGWAFGLLWTLFCMRLASARPDSDTAASPN